MVYVAYGALILSLPVLYYVHRQSKWRPWRGFQETKGSKRASPPSITFGSPDQDVNEGYPDRSFEKAKRHDPEPDSGDAVTNTQSKNAVEVNEKATDGSAPPPFIRTTHDERPVAANVNDKAPITRMDLEPLAKPTPGTTKSAMPPPARPGPRLRPKANNNSLLPPATPQPRPNSLRAPPTISSSLHPPPSAASTLRTAPSRSLAAPNSSPAVAPSTSTLPSSQRPSKKVLLEPGHSPLDWANLIQHPPSPTYLRGADVPSNLVRVTPSMLRHHNGRKGKNAWGVWHGKVYNLTPYMKFHPGGVDELMKGAGREKDGERLFMEVHPWVNWEGLLAECMVGILVGEEESSSAVRKEGGGLEDMD